MLTYNFNNNHNGKLFNDVFGEIMLRNEINIGDEFSIVLKGLEMGTARVEEIRFFPFSRLSNAASLINCGQPTPYQAAMLNRYYNQGKLLPPDQQIAHVIFRYTKRNIENLELKLTEWLTKQKESYDTIDNDR